MKPFQPGTVFDALGAFPDGMNSDIPPVLLPRTQLAFARNCTLRGNYVINRSAYRQIALTFSSEEVQTYFETGTFQGCCFYQPDTDPEFLIASIGGRLFRVTDEGALKRLDSLEMDD